MTHRNSPVVKQIGTECSVQTVLVGSGLRRRFASARSKPPRAPLSQRLMCPAGIRTLAYLPRRALRPRGVTPVAAYHQGYSTLAWRNGVIRLRRIS